MEAGVKRHEAIRGSLKKWFWIGISILSVVVYSSCRDEMEPGIPVEGIEFEESNQPIFTVNSYFIVTIS